MQIYLVAKGRFKGVLSLNLSKISFMKFSVNLAEFDALIITSKNALKALKYAKIPLKFSGVLYAVGEESAKFARNLGFLKVKCAAKAYGIELVSEFKDELKGKKVLYLRGEKIASNLPQMLENEGVNVRQIIVYKSEFAPPKKRVNLSRPAIFIFTSPSSVGYFKALYAFKSGDKCVCIGQSTAKALPKGVESIICEKQSVRECVRVARNLIAN